MDLVPVLSCNNNSKKYDGNIWWKDFSNIVEVNGKPVTEHLKSASLWNTDTALVKFGSKSKKLFKEIVELQPECDKGKVPTPTISRLEEDTLNYTFQLSLSDVMLDRRHFHTMACIDIK